ncbi:thioredoxin domain-containing protein [Chloroflexota bacterium]
MTRKENNLSSQKSPYLLQHAENPVDWYPWSEEAFEKAKKENKPVFLSIGYSTCHWCHVMAHESFEDPEVAELMNETFVSVKVDREERPDIDGVYMTVCQMMTGSGGWPLTIIMTPNKEPFFAATYIPKETRFGRVGMLTLISRIKELWSTRQAEVLSSASQITASLQKTTPEAPGEGLNETLLHLAYEQLAERFDERHGGFGSAPKFPTPHNILFLLRYWKRTRNQKALNIVEKTLQSMRRGGIYDHIGFGFHRYSTDSRWLVPHFEKMLYDQALLAIAYTEAYQATRKKEYAQTAREIFTYVLRDMTSPEGGFYSAEDADSEGEEGKFYVWTSDEIQRILPDKEANLALKVFNISKEGNFVDEVVGSKTGRNILHLTKSVDELTSELSMSVPDLRARIEEIQEALFAYREKRVHPHKDDKILTDWNGLMIVALAKGAQVFDEPKYATAARRAAEFILNNVRTAEGRLMHRYRDGEAALTANVDDYAFLIYGLLELYEATFDMNNLKTALELNDDLIRHFWDQANGGLYFTADDGERLFFRQKEIYDGAVPSGNSVAMLNLLRLGRITASADLEEKAAKIGQAFHTNVSQLPSAYTQFMVAFDFAVGSSYEVVIAGSSQGDDTKKMLNAIRGIFVPNKIVILHLTDQKPPGITDIVPLIKDYSSKNGKAIAYVCLNYNCQLPTKDVGSVLRLLGADQALESFANS